MNEFFLEQKHAMYDYLSRYILRKRNELGRVHQMGAESADRLLEFTEKGKMLRGGLVVLAYQLTREDPENRPVPDEVLALGAVMELFQSGFLIHDDIMDRDEKRRGTWSVYTQYSRLAAEMGIKDSYHAGESLGICVGDIAFFMAFEILAGISTDWTGSGSKPGERLFGLCAQELSYVGVAQMMDVYWGESEGTVTEQEVLELYRYKTGRYTFSLPLMSGALMSGAAQEQREALEKIGELLGVVFQLKDDELGLFGDEEQLGKPVGSDIKEGKKTPFLLRLMQRGAPREQERVSSLIGNESISSDDAQYIRGLVERYGIRQEIADLCQEYADRARTIIDKTDGFNPAYKKILNELIEYSLTRSR